MMFAMLRTPLFFLLPAALLLAQVKPRASDPTPEAEEARLRATIAASPKLPLDPGELKLIPPRADWAVDMVSSTSSDGKGTIYLLQRGDKADPVLAVNREGKLLRSWGKGMFKIPHSIRVDPQGNVWTVDAASSMIYQFTPEGKKLLEISVGGQPEGRSEFRGTADLTFAPGGRIFVADGYGNARIIEYARDGKRVREWGKHGTGPGEFVVPHGITAGSDGILYVADRENGRIQRFDLDGHYKGEWTHLGKTFSITMTRQGELYIGTQPRNKPNGSPGWLVKVDPKTGKALGHVESNGHHSVEFASGDLFTGQRPDKVLWFRKR